MPGGGIGGSANIDPKLIEMYPAIFMAMIETADIVAERYGVSREYQDEYSLAVAAAHGRRAGRTGSSPTRSCR